MEKIVLLEPDIRIKTKRRKVSNDMLSKLIKNYSFPALSSPILVTQYREDNLTAARDFSAYANNVCRNKILRSIFSALPTRSLSQYTSRKP